VPIKHKIVVCVLTLLFGGWVMVSDIQWLFPVMLAVGAVLFGVGQSLAWYLKRNKNSHKDK